LFFHLRHQRSLGIQFALHPVQFRTLILHTPERDLEWRLRQHRGRDRNTWGHDHRSLLIQYRGRKGYPRDIHLLRHRRWP
jgi:hypothetical protein